tara:strand:+ start:5896 stop:6219 length:324 start_codon:yes stop_codon:yes gene_type:complete
MNRFALLFVSLLCITAGTSQAAMDSGQEVYQKWCMPCHDRGDKYPGTIALAARYKGSVPAALVDRTDLTPAFIEHFVRHGISVMPFFRKTEITDVEMEMLSDYLSHQ